jgi:hypothetical protein
MYISRLCPLTVLHPPGGMHTHPAWVGSTGVSTGVALRQRLQQRPGLLEVGRIKAFREPVVDRCQEAMGFLTFALLLPESSQADGGS